MELPPVILTCSPISVPIEHGLFRF